MRGSDFHEIYSNSRNRNRAIKREIKVIISMYITAKSFCGSKKAIFSRHINVSDIRKMHQRLSGLKIWQTYPMALCFPLWEIHLLSMMVYSMVTSNSFSLKEYKQRSSIFYIYVWPTGLIIILQEIWNFVVEISYLSNHMYVIIMANMLNK